MFMPLQYLFIEQILQVLSYRPKATLDTGDIMAHKKVTIFKKFPMGTGIEEQDNDSVKLGQEKGQDASECRGGSPSLLTHYTGLFGQRNVS